MAEPVTLTKAMGIDGIAFTYEGAAVPESLRLSSYYTLPDPAAGKQYVIAGYRLTNKTDSPINVSIAQMRPVFTATIGDESVNAGIVLEDDLGSIVMSQHITPGIIYVAAKTGDEAFPSEYYIAERDCTELSQEAMARTGLPKASWR